MYNSSLQWIFNISVINIYYFSLAITWLGCRLLSELTKFVWYWSPKEVQLIFCNRSPFSIRVVEVILEMVKNKSWKKTKELIWQSSNVQWIASCCLPIKASRFFGSKGCLTLPYSSLELPFPIRTLVFSSSGLNTIVSKALAILFMSWPAETQTSLKSDFITNTPESLINSVLADPYFKRSYSFFKSLLRSDNLVICHSCSRQNYILF